jgi:glycosyltransferase involved in cell wall biosynthesis
MPRVSIVVPNYNHERYLAARLDSIFAQTYRDYEVILLDDCSSDRSAELLAAYAERPRVAELVLNRSNLGPFGQWQLGMAKAKGEYLWIAESDDVAEPAFLEHMVAALDGRPAVGVAYCQSRVIDEDGQILFDNRRWTNDLDPELWGAPFQLEGTRSLRDFFVFKNVIPNASAVLFRRKLFERVSPEITEFRYTGDWLAWTDILRDGDLYFTPELLNRFRYHAQSTRVRRRFEQTAQYLGEVYRIVSRIARRADVGDARRNEAYDQLAIKSYREIGVRSLPAPRSLRLIGDLCRYDSRLPERLLKLTLRAAKRKVFGP